VVPRPEILSQTTAIPFGGLPINETTVQQIPVRLVNVSGTVTVTPPEGYEISVNGGATTPTFYNKAVTVTPSAAGALTLTIRFKPTAVKSYDAVLNIVSINNASVSAAITLQGRGVARTTRVGGVQVIDDKYFVDNKLFYPVGWSQAAGVPPSFIDKKTGALTFQGDIIDGVNLTTNPSAYIQGNIIEHEGITSVMDIGYTLKNLEATKPKGSRFGGDYSSISDMIEYTKAYLDLLRSTGMKVMFPTPRVHDKKNNPIEVTGKNTDATGQKKKLIIPRIFTQAETERFVKEIADYEATKTSSPLFGWWHVGEPELRFRQLMEGDEGFFQRPDNTSGYDYFDKPATFEAALDIINSNWSASDVDKAFFYRPQSYLATLYTSLKQLDPEHSFHLMTGPHAPENMWAHLYRSDMYGDPAKPFFDDFQAQMYMTDVNNFPGEDPIGYARTRHAYDALPESDWNDKVFRFDYKNFKNRWYNHDIRPEPSFHLSILESYTKNNRRYHIQMNPNGGHQAVPSLKSSAITYNENVGRNSNETCLSCHGEAKNRPSTLTEQMYYIFSSLYWMQEPDLPRVVNYGKIVFFSYDCTGTTERTMYNSILKLFTDFRIGEAIVQPKISPNAALNPTTPVRVSTNAGQETTVKTIVRQFNGYYYVIVVNNRDNNDGVIPAANADLETVATRDAQIAQKFAANPNIRISVADQNVITAAEELIIGSGTPTAVTLQTLTRTDGTVEQQLPAMTLQPAEVRIFRFKIVHPTASVQPVALAFSKEESQVSSSQTQAVNERTLPANEEIPSLQSLSVSPNPATDIVTAHLALPTDETVSLTVYDMHGKIMLVPVATRLAAAGRHEVYFAATALPSGVYVCVMQTRTQSSRVFLHVIR
jgi:hypothetical protein